MGAAHRGKHWEGGDREGVSREEVEEAVAEQGLEMGVWDLPGERLTEEVEVETGRCGSLCEWSVESEAS